MLLDNLKLLMIHAFGQGEWIINFRNRMKNKQRSLFKDEIRMNNVRCIKNEREVILNYFPSQSFFRFNLITSSS